MHKREKTKPSILHVPVVRVVMAVIVYDTARLVTAYCYRGYDIELNIPF